MASMAEVRRHAERAHHVSFIRLCPTCNEHFFDKEFFEENHGTEGRRCNNPRKQARGTEAQGAQWQKIYDLIYDGKVVSPTAVGESPSLVEAQRNSVNDLMDVEPTELPSNSRMNRYFVSFFHSSHASADQ